MYCQKVKQFTVLTDPNLPDTPKKLNKTQIKFAIKMLKDELKELKEAKDITEQADAFVDIIYYSCNLALKNGINLDPIFDIVHDCNMKKVVNGKIIRRDDGKILKPKNWIGPEELIKENINKQLKNDKSK